MWIESRPSKILERKAQQKFGQNVQMMHLDKLADTLQLVELLHFWIFKLLDVKNNMIDKDSNTWYFVQYELDGRHA